MKNYLPKWGLHILIKKFLDRMYILCFDFYSTITKIRTQTKIDNFAFKNSNIIIEGPIWMRKDYFSWKKFEIQKNNVINKFYFCPILFSYRFESNFWKWCDSNKLWFIFFRKKILYNLTVSYFWNWINYYQIQQFVYKYFVLKNCFFIISAIKEFIFKNRKRSSCRESFS